MTITQSVILGILQGLTELLPISSSAHLFLISWAFGWLNSESFQIAFDGFDVALHAGTLLAICIFFFKDWLQLIVGGWKQVVKKEKSFEGKMFWYIVLATIPGGIIGFIGEGKIVLSNITSNINVYGSTCNAGGISGNGHYNNVFENCSSSGNVTLQLEDDVGNTLSIGGIAGIWVNTTGKVTFRNCRYTGTLTSIDAEGNMVTEFLNDGIVGCSYNASGSGVLVIN